MPSALKAGLTDVPAMLKSTSLVIVYRLILLDSEVEKETPSTMFMVLNKCHHKID
jgi:hypothetical protein